VWKVVGLKKGKKCENLVKNRVFQAKIFSLALFTYLLLDCSIFSGLPVSIIA